MEETVKKSRKKVHVYNFADQSINLNGYVARCTVTGNEKRFYHSYLANMIVKKFDNNFALFENTYVSREGKSVGAADRKVDVIEERINKLYSKIAQLKSQRNQLQAA